MMVIGCLRSRLACVAAVLLGVASASFAQVEVRTQMPTVAPSQIRQSEAASQKTSKPPEQPSVSQQVFERGAKPDWIWGPDQNRNYVLRKEFDLPEKFESAAILASCDNRMTIFVNGQRVAAGSEWNRPTRADVRAHLNPGKNVVTARVANEGGPAAFVFKLAVGYGGEETKYVVSDSSWRAARLRQSNDSVAVKLHGKLGAQPWGNVFANAANTRLPVSSEPRDVFHVLPGFQVELLYTVPKEEQGSWVSIAFDDRGRLIASDQQNKGLYRVTPPPIGSSQPTQVEKLDVEISASQGMLYAFGSLYVSVNGGPGSGFYRVRDTDGDDQFDSVEKLKALQGGGEHGPHALRLSPDGKSIFLIAGNHTNPPQNFDASRLPANWGEDLLLPRQWDARGHARGKLAPGGWIAKTDPAGKTWEMYSSGYRNAYDMDFNADGELFAYDADMEWDMGSPWYRPTRVMHATSGSEFGWRSGTGKWPAYYADSLPATIDIGPGSPVGVAFGYGAKFPAKYQKALYILDWTFGTIYALHLQPEGASYTATKEEFLSRTPLPLTDVAIGPDGAMYFTIGGRGTQSELFRVTYVGDQSTRPVDPRNLRFAELRQLRKRLEQFHHRAQNQEKVVETVWPHLGHDDRFIRYAARIALEHQDPKLWQDRVFAEDDAVTLIHAAIALARQGDESQQNKLLSALGDIDFKAISEEQQLALIRAYALTFIRMGQPDQQTAAAVAAKFDPFYPAESDDLNRELSRLLVYVQSPTVITKTLKLMEQPTKISQADMDVLLARNERYGGAIFEMLANHPELQKIHYALALRNMRYGWTLPQRKQYFEWLAAAHEKSGGASYRGFIDNIRKEALENASEAEREAIASSVTTPTVKPTDLPKPRGPGHDWKLEELLNLTAGGLSGRDFENGKRTYASSRCIVCHRFDGEGGATGPDLTNVAGRFSLRDLSEAIVDPSKVISDQYRASTIVTAQGQQIIGRIVNETDDKLTVITDPEDANKIAEIDRSDVEEIIPSKISLMPKDLLKTLNREEVLDLYAYLLSRGNPNDRMFRQSD